MHVPKAPMPIHFRFQGLVTATSDPFRAEIIWQTLVAGHVDMGDCTGHQGDPLGFFFLNYCKV